MGCQCLFFSIQSLLFFCFTPLWWGPNPWPVDLIFSLHLILFLYNGFVLVTSSVCMDSIVELLSRIYDIIHIKWCHRTNLSRLYPFRSVERLLQLLFNRWRTWENLEVLSQIFSAKCHPSNAFKMSLSLSVSFQLFWKTSWCHFYSHWVLKINRRQCYQIYA